MSHPSLQVFGVQDVRLFHHVNSEFMLRDYTRREMSLKNADIPVEVLNDPVKLSTVLPLVIEHKHKLIFPSLSV